MKLVRTLILCGLTATFISAATVDTSRTFVLLKEGQQLTPAKAAEEEAQLGRKPDNLEDRIRLLAFYGHQDPAAEAAAIRSSRLRHVIWLVQHQPKAALFTIAPGVYAIQRSGGPLADNAGFESVEQIWKSQINSQAGNIEIKKNAAQFVQIQDPELAEKLLTEMDERRWLGQVYAKAILGIVATDYSTGTPVLTDDKRRNSAFGQRAAVLLDNSSDPLMLGGAAFTLCRDGGILFADGKSDLDYTPMAKRFLAKAATLDPGNSDVFSVIAELPKRGERPTPTIHLGGPVAQKSLLNHVDPVYPLPAKAAGVQGVVNVQILIGLDGRVLKIKVVSGPLALVPAATDAVLQWTYSPMLMSGKPVYVMTSAAINFQL